MCEFAELSSADLERKIWAVRARVSMIKTRGILQIGYQMRDDQHRKPLSLHKPGNYALERRLSHVLRKTCMKTPRMGTKARLDGLLFGTSEVWIFV